MATDASAGPVLTRSEWESTLWDYAHSQNKMGHAAVTASLALHSKLDAHDAALRAEVDAGKRATLEACDLWRKEKDDYLREKARADAAEAEVEALRNEFLRGVSWAYQELTGALIVPASFEQKALEARDER